MNERKLTMDERIMIFMERMSPFVKRDVVAWLESHGFFTAPASIMYHGAYDGGLFDHSFEVTQTLWKLTKDNSLKWDRPESPLIVGMFHDLCKTDSYKANFDGWTYNNDTILKGHGDKSVMMLASLMKLTEEEVACIRYHMGAFVKQDEWNDYTRAVRSYPNVLWTHHADMIASHVKGV